MPYRSRRSCPICCKSGLLYLSDHLRQVHNLSMEERKPLLKSVVFSVAESMGLPYWPSYSYWGMPHYPISMNPHLHSSQVSLSVLVTQHEK